MKVKKSYRITIEDETKLEKIASRSYSTPALIGIISGVVLCLILFGASLVAFTPIRTLMPGYYRNSQRGAAEEAFLKLDSLQDACQKNEAYMANLMTVLDIDRKPTDSILMTNQIMAPSADSLLPRSPEEARFAATMQEREKFNISVLASIASEGMLLYPVSNDGIISDASKNAFDAEIILPDKSSVMAIADGVVIDAFYDSRKRCNTILMQHDNGFVSRLSGLGTLFISKSDVVNGGEIISDSPAKKAGMPQTVTLSLWHNGTPVKPYGFMRGNTYQPPRETTRRLKQGSRSRTDRNLHTDSVIGDKQIESLDL